MSNVVAVIGITIFYSIILLYVGYLGYKKTSLEPSDYFLGGRSFGTFVLSLTFIATYASMWTFMGAVGSNYRSGMSFMTAMMTWNILWPIMLLIVGSRLWVLSKKYNYITPSDMFADYYQSEPIRVIASVIGVVSLIPYLSIQLIGGGLAFEAATNGLVPYHIGALLMLVIMLVYGLIGGLRAVAWTDVIQGIFFLVTLFGLSIWAFAKGGGNIFKAVAETRPELFSPGNWSYKFWLGFVLTWGLSILLPHQIQRAFSSRNAKIIVKSSSILTVLSGWVQSVPVMIIGIAGAFLLPGLTGSDTDSVIVLLIAKYAPLLASILVASAVAAGMSTLDSQLLSASSLVTRDIYTRYIKTDATPKDEARAGQFILVLLAVICYIFVLTKPGLIVPLATAGAAICIAGYLFPVIGALFWPRVGKTAALWSMIAGGGTAFVTFAIWKYPLGIHNAVWGLLVSGVVFIVLAYITPPLPYEQQVKFHGLLEKTIYEHDSNVFGSEKVDRAI